MKRWMLPVGLLLVVGMLGCGGKPEPVVEEAKQSLLGPPDLGRDAAIAEIEKMGGWLVYEEGASANPVIRVTLMDTQVTDAGLEHLKGMTNLRYLHLGDTQVTDAGVNELKKALPNCRIDR